MSRASPVILAATLLVVLAAPLVQADHSSTTCSDFEMHMFGPADGCTKDGLYLDPNDDPRNTVEIATVDDGATFTGEIEITFENSKGTETLTVGMIAGTIDSASNLGPIPTDDVTVTVDIFAYQGMHPTGNWQVTINHHQP